MKLAAIHLAAPVEGMRTISRDHGELTDNERGIVVVLGERRLFVPWSNIAAADLWPEPPTVPLPQVQVDAPRKGRR